ncbi:MAG: CDP-alcohol phosphatidyltransferase family protein [Phycisphaeraceae bacterium]
MPEKKHIPNLLTMLRLVLAAAFFTLLAFYQYGSDESWMLLPAIGLFIAAAATDALDGYYARLWQVESKFGRIMDPFCDKVLVLGALMFLAGPNFAYESFKSVDGTAVVKMIQASGVYPWMVVVILARELLVTGIRGELEGSGHKFGANVWGKLKMVLQSVVVPAVLLIAFAMDKDIQFSDKLALPRDLLVYATVVVTVLSGLPYVTGAYRVVKAERPDPSSPG